MNEQEMREALANGQEAMAEMIAKSGLDYDHPLVAVAEQMSQRLMAKLVDWVQEMGLADDKMVDGDGAKVILLATASLAISASLVARVSRESKSKEQVDALINLAKKLNQEGERH